MKVMMDNLSELTRHPFAGPILSAAILGIGSCLMKMWHNRLTKKATIEVNQAAERGKFEIQKAYMLTEIKTRNLLEIYPKLHNSIHVAAGPIVAYFTTISDQIDRLRLIGREPDEKQLRQFFEDYWQHLCSREGYLDISNIQKFNNYLIDAKLFMSKNAVEISEEMREAIMKLVRLIRNEIESGSYAKYSRDQIFKLLDEAHLGISSLNQNKDHLARTMNEELTSCI